MGEKVLDAVVQLGLLKVVRVQKRCVLKQTTTALRRGNFSHSPNGTLTSPQERHFMCIDPTFVLSRILPSPAPIVPLAELPTLPTTVIGLSVFTDPTLVEALTCADN